MVPDSDAAFYATLPITLPLGLGAIVADTFVAHPIQVIDDAWDDAGEVWGDIDLEQHYYTQAGFMPLRALATPVVFLGSFLGRSMFVWPSAEQQAEWQASLRARQRRQILDWLGRIARGEDETRYRRLAEPIDETLIAAVRAALADGRAGGRILVYQAVAASNPHLVDWNEALADTSAVVRYRVVALVPKDHEPDAAILETILNDPDEAVRDRARRRWAK